jgi:hypothetical protein
MRLGEQDSILVKVRFVQPRHDLLWGPPNFLNTTETDNPLHGLVRPGREADHELLSSTQDDMKWNYTPLAPSPLHGGA